MAINDTQRDEVLRLHAQGIARNEIARRVGISAGSVTNICNAHHRSFDRSATKAAQAARSLDLAAARLKLAERLDVAANAMLDMIEQPFTVYAFGGRDNVFNSATLDSAPVDARRTIITSAAIVFDKLSKVIESTTEGSADAESVLDRLEAEFDGEFTDVDDAEFGQ
ncbi:hypothetical protein RR49_01172 [Microbacterium ginsengisoli]|uniref:Resolvase HTH domain-containing protein n=1 Tax=Microbacterium ginsengisoli TaxID=400772 RepID=A0A0F0LXP5_9MICO|nr:helix-turn-helix domain-containing protein [Microbacterium ginsengisoli]KJL37060.1 hypothetical protein RR49_01172 [Microbacterium ginsengisoli]